MTPHTEPQRGEAPIGVALGTRDARSMALRCCQDMGASFKPPKFPERPAVLWPCDRDQLERLRRIWLRDSGERMDPEHEGKTLLPALKQWECELASAEHEFAARLRGAFWAVVALRGCLGTDPNDAQAAQMLSALARFLEAHWGVAEHEVPASLAERDQLARDMAAHVRRQVP